MALISQMNKIKQSLVAQGMSKLEHLEEMENMKTTPERVFI